MLRTTAIDTDGIDRIIAEAKNIKPLKKFKIMNALIDYCQWLHYVTADDLDMFRMLHAKASDAAITKTMQIFIGNLSVPNHFKITLFVLRIMR